MGAYFEDAEMIFDTIEEKNRNPDYNRGMKMQGTTHVWGEDDFDQVTNQNPLIKHTLWGVLPYDTVKKALWSVLEVKTTGEAGDIIEFLGNDTGAARKNGFEAYRRVHQWYTELTGEALSVRRDRFFNPQPPKNEEDVAKAIQKWEFDRRELQALDPSIADAPTWMFANALKKFLVGALATEIFTQQTRWVGEGKTEKEQFVEMKRHMCNWAAQKSLLARSAKDGNLDEVTHGDAWYEHDNGYSYGLNEWYNESYYTDDNWNAVCEYTSEGNDEVSYDTGYPADDWELCNFQLQKGKGKGGKGKGKGKGGKGFPLGKGYGKGGKTSEKGGKGPGKGYDKGKGGKGKGGKGKGFQGLCYTCGMPGHTAAQCEHFNGNCNACGQWGHRAANCPQQKSVSAVSPSADGMTKVPTVTHPVVDCTPCNSSGTLGSLSPCMTLGKAPQFTQEMRNKCLGRVCAVSTPVNTHSIQHSLATSGIRSVNMPTLTDTNKWVDVVKGTMKFCPKSHKPVTTSNSFLALQHNEGENQDPGWELIEVTVDSGACGWVANSSVAKAFRITPTEASKAGV